MAIGQTPGPHQPERRNLQDSMGVAANLLRAGGAGALALFLIDEPSGHSDVKGFRETVGISAAEQVLFDADTNPSAALVALNNINTEPPISLASAVFDIGTRLAESKQEPVRARAAPVLSLTARMYEKIDRREADKPLAARQSLLLQHIGPLIEAQAQVGDDREAEITARSTAQSLLHVAEATKLQEDAAVEEALLIRQLDVALQISVLALGSLQDPQARRLYDEITDPAMQQEVCDVLISRIEALRPGMQDEAAEASVTPISS